MDNLHHNILACYDRASSYDIETGTNWYPTAQAIADRIAAETGTTLAIVSGVIAALSPGNYWINNVNDAESIIEAFQDGKRNRKLPIVGVYGRRNRDKAQKILSGMSPLDVLGGPKTRAFYCNILFGGTGNPSHITIDRHAKSAAYNLVSPATSIVRPSEYNYIANHYSYCAGVLNMHPTVLQSIVWVTWRRLHGVLQQEDLFT